jgi:putative DNA primase/helicase
MEAEIIQEKSDLIFKKIFDKVGMVQFPSMKATAILPTVCQELKKITNDLCCTEQGTYLLFIGTHWIPINKQALGCFLRDVSQKMGAPADTTRVYYSIDGLIRQFEYDFFQDSTSNQNCINFINGTLHLKNFDFCQHDRGDSLSYVLGYNYDAKASCELFKKYLEKVQPDPDTRKVIQEAAGYCFSTDLRFEKIPVFFGDGCNGKSVFLETLSGVLGSENTTSFTLDQITNPNGSALAQMRGKLLNVSNENNQKINNTAVFKSYVSREAIPVRILYHDPIMASDYSPSILAANELPITEDYSKGFYRRFLFIPWNVTITDDEKDIQLIDKLKAERSGIINWVIEGARRLRKQEAYTRSIAAEHALTEYRKSSDSVALFMDENEYVPDQDQYAQGVKLQELYKELQRFCQENGFSIPSTKTLSKRLRLLGVRVDRGTKNQVFVKIKNNAETLPF